jgi:hypothetical protein
MTACLLLATTGSPPARPPHDTAPAEHTGLPEGSTSGVRRFPGPAGDDLPTST